MYRNLMPLTLASASPRRKELLARLGLQFDIIPSGVDENGLDGADPEASARRCARAKAEAVARRLDRAAGGWVLGVDTIVVIDGRVLGKPRDRDEARSFLRLLAGRTHLVVSGYCLMRPGGGEAVEKSVNSMVRIRRLSDPELEAYLDSDEPYDKAGAYAAQGLGASLVEALEGSYTNVVGLPLAELLADLLALGAIRAETRSG